MVKRILLLVNSLCLFLCLQGSAYEEGNDIVFLYKDMLDRSVNDLTLMDKSHRFTREQVKTYLVDDTIHCEGEVVSLGEGIFLSNVDQSEYLFCGISYGGSCNQFARFIITDTINPVHIKNQKVITIEDKQFVTDGGAYLGMSITEFRKLYPNLSYTGQNQSFVYTQRDADELLSNYFTFESGKLKKIEIHFAP